MLPRGLEPGTVEALLASCDRDEPSGKRDYAVILLLARLGLRAGEAARLRLDDISWRAGEIGIRGKGGQYDVLPLPAVIFSFQDRHVVDLGGHVEDGVVDVTAVAA
jgi:integrase